MRQSGSGTITFEDSRTWIEETGLCLFLPPKQPATFVAPSFVEAVAGERVPAPGAKLIAQGEELLVRLEADGVAVRLNLLGQPGEQSDFVVASWVLPYVYALRGDRDWRRSPQQTGSRAVSPLATLAYKLLEASEADIAHLKHALGREVTESAVLRAITELWQQLRIIPVHAAAGVAPKWQLLRVRYQKAIAEGASTSQVTAISVLASIYLQAVIAATMEEVELFLAPLTARSKVREVLRGLVATRQVHTISLGHAPHFYVAGTLPEFSAAPTLFGGAYASSAMPASAEFLRSYERDRDESAPAAAAAKAETASSGSRKQAETVRRMAAEAEDQSQPRFSRKPAHARSRKPGSRPTLSSTNRGSANRNSSSRSSSSRSSASRSSAGHPASRATGSSHNSAQPRWQHGASKNGNGSSSNGKSGATHAKAANGLHKSASTAERSQRNGHAGAGKPAAKSSARPVSRHAAIARKDSRADARSHRKPAMAGAAKSSAGARYGASGGQRSKKRG